MPFVGAVADDLTGATTVGVLLARSDAKTIVYFDEKVIGQQSAAKADAVIISTNSRALPAAEAYEKVKAATCALQKVGTSYYQKRIDTTMRGGIGVEIDAMLDVLPSDMVAVVVPAMPQSRRVLVGGYSIIDGVPLVQTPAAQDVRTPVTEDYIPRLIAQQTKRKVGLVALDKVLAGKEDIMKALIKQHELECQVIVVDAITVEDVEAIAKACVELKWQVLSVDPGPFTAELARCRGVILAANADVAEKETGQNKKKGTVLIAAGSATEITKKQMSFLGKDRHNVCVSVDPKALVQGGLSAEKEIDTAVERTVKSLTCEEVPRAVLLETALHGSLLNLEEEDFKHGYISGTSADKINEGLGKIVRRVLDRTGRKKIAGLYMTGGDTMVHVCRQLGAEGLEVLDYVIPQTDISRLSGGSYNGLPVIGKGGMTGYDTIVEEIVSRLLGMFD